MLKTLPYTALRTLEAVVRLRGFGRAAEELNVTQSAVSQNVRVLEEWLGQPLLVRLGRRTTPTEAGERLAQAIRDGFGGIEIVCDDLRGQTRADRTTVLMGAPPGFAFLWLLPRLLKFDHANPEISVSLATDPASRDPAVGAADAFIAYATGGFPGLHAEPLMVESLSPVCAPALKDKLHSVKDLAHQTILQDSLDSSEFQSHWHVWAQETGHALPAFRRTRTHGQANLVVQAAIQGLGVAMGRGPLVADAIADGRLVYPFAEIAHSQPSYWFVCRHETLRTPAVETFRRWLQREAHAFSTAQTNDSEAHRPEPARPTSPD